MRGHHAAEGRSVRSTVASGAPQRLPRQRAQRPVPPYVPPRSEPGVASAKGGQVGLAGLQGHR
eukprot:3531794-Alexandrium_andersonii.AAC.1